MVANYDPGQADVVEYEILYRDSFVTNPNGRTKVNPLIVEAGAVYEGYVSISDIPELQRPNNFYRYDAEEDGTLRVKLQPSSQDNDVFTAGLQVIRDANQNGKLDDPESYRRIWRAAGSHRTRRYDHGWDLLYRRDATRPRKRVRHPSR